MDPVCFEPGAGPDDPRADSGGRSAGLMERSGRIRWGSLWPFIATLVIALSGYLASR